MGRVLGVPFSARQLRIRKAIVDILKEHDSLNLGELEDKVKDEMLTPPGGLFFQKTLWKTIATESMKGDKDRLKINFYKGDNAPSELRFELAREGDQRENVM